MTVGADIALGLITALTTGGTLLFPGRAKRIVQHDAQRGVEDPVAEFGAPRDPRVGSEGIGTTLIDHRSISAL